jgi:hypothetical protein
MRFSASRIATLLGRFGASQRSDAIIEVWQRCDEDGLRRALDRKHVAPTLVPEPVQALLIQPCASPHEVAERKVQVQTALQNLPIAQTPQEKAAQIALVQHCEREINTSFGTHQENPVVQRFQEQFGQAVQLDPRLHRKSYGTFELQGKIDGRLADGRVLEIKNRVRGLFREVRDYEMMQVQTYLDLLDAPSAILCEAYRGELAWLEVPRDPDWFRERVLEPLTALSGQLQELWQDEAKQDQLLEGKIMF